MKKAMLKPWHTIYLITMACVLAACEPAPPAAKASSPMAAANMSAPASAPDGRVDASPLGVLQQYVGAYPSASNVSFLEQGVLAERLKKLLGKDYPTLLQNLRTVGPLTEDAGRWFITGNRPHEGGTEEAAVVVDAAHNAIRVWMLHEGKVHEYQDPSSASVPWPREVQTMQDNHRPKAAS